MPVADDEGTQAETLGSNVPIMAQALRTHGFPGAHAGAAHVRWPEGEPRPHEGPFGVIVIARQSVRAEGGSYTEHATTLHCATVPSAGESQPVVGHARGALLRTLGRATVRREPEESAILIAAMSQAEAKMVSELRPPSETDREARVWHAVTPLLATVIG